MLTPRTDVRVSWCARPSEADEVAVTDLSTGLAQFLTDQFGETYTVTNLSASSAGARRGNVLFDAKSDGSTLHLVATILPTADIQINPITAEAGVRLVAEEHGVPVPHVHAVCTDSSYAGGPFFLSERIDGESVPRRVLRLVQSEGIGDLVATQLGAALAHLHAADPAQAPDELRDDPSENPAETALINAEQGVAGLLVPRPAMAMGLRWLERRLPGPPPKRTIVHTDVRNGNIIVSPEGLVAVLDWEGTVRHGDPMQDLAWPALRMWRFREDKSEICGFADREPFVAGYERAGGTFDEERFEWWKVLGTLRWGLGLAGQTHQHLNGEFPNIVMAASGRRVPELEWDLLMLVRPAGARSG
jgi:aminoglycoside phosphotransferase (APT) family kinase protein